MADSEALQVTLLVTSVLDNLGIPYVIGGSMASIIHGMLRTTMDVDIVADMQLEHVSSIVAKLQDAFYVDETAIHQAIQRRSSFNLIHLTTMFKVDIFLPKERAFDQQQLKRHIAESVGPDADVQLWVFWFSVKRTPALKKMGDSIGLGILTLLPMMMMLLLRPYADAELKQRPKLGTCYASGRCSPRCRWRRRLSA